MNKKRQYEEGPYGLEGAINKIKIKIIYFPSNTDNYYHTHILKITVY